MQVGPHPHSQGSRAFALLLAIGAKLYIYFILYILHYILHFLQVGYIYPTQTQQLSGCLGKLRKRFSDFKSLLVVGHQSFAHENILSMSDFLGLICR